MVRYTCPRCSDVTDIPDDDQADLWSEFDSELRNAGCACGDYPVNPVYEIDPA